ncbi:hypothetical protein LSAT2_017236 [Lamellibrachia satsuma]|nr:hypothetical protein LSAT2_017236 [Lamellibrachia satsuma]
MSSSRFPDASVGNDSATMTISEFPCNAHKIDTTTTYIFGSHFYYGIMVVRGHLVAACRSYNDVVVGCNSYNDVVMGSNSYNEVVVGSNSYNDVVVGSNSYNDVVVGSNSYNDVVVGSNSYNDVVVGSNSYNDVVVGCNSYNNVAVGSNSYNDVVVGSNSYNNVVVGSNSYNYVVVGSNSYNDVVVGFRAVAPPRQPVEPGPLPAIGLDRLTRQARGVKVTTKMTNLTINLISVAQSRKPYTVSLRGLLTYQASGDISHHVVAVVVDVAVVAAVAVDASVDWRLSVDNALVICTQARQVSASETYMFLRNAVCEWTWECLSRCDQ